MQVQICHCSIWHRRWSGPRGAASNCGVQIWKSSVQRGWILIHHLKRVICDLGESGRKSWSIPIVRWFCQQKYFPFIQTIFYIFKLISHIQGSAIKAKILLRVPFLRWRQPWTHLRAALSRKTQTKAHSGTCSHMIIDQFVIELLSCDLILMWYDLVPPRVSM